MKKLAIISTHPIQYNAPLFRLLSERSQIELKVYYTWSQVRDKVEDRGFGKSITWDIPLLDGYPYEFIENVAKKPGNKSYFGINNPDLIGKVKDFQPSAIMVYGWNYKSHLDVIRYFSGKIPVWFRGDSHLLDEKRSPKTLLRRVFLKWVYSHVDMAYYVGRNNKKYFLKHGFTEQQLVYAPHAIENDRFVDISTTQYEQRAQAWREKLKYTENDKVVLFAGKFEFKKNPQLLIKAIQQINETTNQRINLLLVGNGILEKELKELARGIKYIQFLPFQNQSVMPVVYRLGDVFCLPSQGPGETWGLAINEAMACGRPVIASNKVGGAIDLIKERENGFTFRSNDLEDLKQKINLIFSNHEILNQMSKKSHSIIQDFNYQKICQAIEDQLGE